LHPAFAGIKVIGLRILVLLMLANGRRNKAPNAAKGGRACGLIFAVLAP
jgi:hypothetical protein